MAGNYEYKALKLSNLMYDPENKVKNINDTVGYMLDRSRRMFKWTGLPDTIPERNLEIMLQRFGHVFITKVNGELYALHGSYGGQPNAYYEPTEYIAPNPYLKGVKDKYIIGKDGVLLRNDTLMIGMLPLFSKYATLMVENELTIADVEILARAMLVITADKENDIEEVQKFINSLKAGKLLAIGTEKIMTKNGTVEVQPGATSSANIITQLIELQQYLKGSWWNEIGLNSNWNAKHENITSSENLLNDDGLLPLYDDLKECRQLAIDEINEMFGTSISIDSDSSWKNNEIETELAQKMMENGGDEDVGDRTTEEKDAD